MAAAAAYSHRRSQAAQWVPPGGRVVSTSSLRVRLVGEAGPPVLLLHGLVASNIFWGGAYDRLGGEGRLVVPDLVGFGGSPRPMSGYGPDDHGDAVLACLDELGVDDPVVVGAHSLGALVALRVAATHPDRIAAIVAFGPPVYPDSRTARAHVAATSPMGRLFVLPGRVAEDACRWVCDHRSLAARLSVLTHPGLPEAIAADAVQHTWTSYAQTLELVILAAGAARWLERVRCPVHLVAGDRDPVVDQAYLRRLAAQYDNLQLSVWAGRHDLPIVRAAHCASTIAAMGAQRPAAAALQ